MINTTNMASAYSEVYAFLEISDEKYKNSLPKKIYNVIKDNRDLNYIPKYNQAQEITKDVMSKEAIVLISALNLQYWCADENEKNRLKKKYIENGKKEQEKYSYENLFKKEDKDKVVVKEKQNETAMIEYKKQSFIVKFINKIKKVLKNKI